MAILKAAVKVRGVRPLLQHKFGPESLPLEKQERSGVAGNSPDEWRKTCMVTADGQLYVAPTYIFATLRDGARHTKKGRGSIQPMVVATLQVTDNRILLDRWFPGFPNGHKFDALTAPEPPQDTEAPVFLDVCGVRNPSNKARNVRYRIGASVGWITEFNLMWESTIVDRGQMQAVIIDAGRFNGLGDGRSVGYGRFELDEFKIQD